MAESVQIAIFEGGELLLPSAGGKLREVVLALPLSRLLVKMIRVPAEQAADPVAYATPILEALSPYPDEPLTVVTETLRETESGAVVLAAAMPEGSAEDLAGALDESGLNVTRIDATALGQLAELSPRLLAEDPAARRLLLIASADCISAIVLDGDLPCAIRAISPGSDLKREVMLSLLEGEAFAGPQPLKEIVTVGEIAAEPLAAFAPLRALPPVADPTSALAARAQDPATINALPASWREVLEETHFKQKLIRWMSLFGGLWLLVMAVLFGVPKYYNYQAGKVEAQRNLIRAKYNEVLQKKEQVDAVKAISNHDRGCLETLRVLASALPDEEPYKDDIVLNRFKFVRGDGISISGQSESGNDNPVRLFKDRLGDVQLSFVTEDEDDAEEPFFGEVTFQGSLKGGRFGFDCRYEEEEEED